MNAPLGPLLRDQYSPGLDFFFANDGAFGHGRGDTSAFTSTDTATAPTESGFRAMRIGDLQVDSRILSRLETRSGHANRVVARRQQIEPIQTVGPAGAGPDGPGCLVRKLDLSAAGTEAARINHSTGEDGSFVLRQDCEGKDPMQVG